VGEEWGAEELAVYFCAWSNGTGEEKTIAWQSSDEFVAQQSEKSRQKGRKNGKNQFGNVQGIERRDQQNRLIRQSFPNTVTESAVIMCCKTLEGFGGGGRGSVEMMGVPNRQ